MVNWAAGGNVWMFTPRFVYSVVFAHICVWITISDVCLYSLTWGIQTSRDNTYGCPNVISRLTIPAQRQHYLKYFDRTVWSFVSSSLLLKEHKWPTQKEVSKPCLSKSSKGWIYIVYSCHWVKNALIPNKSVYIDNSNAFNRQQRWLIYQQLPASNPCITVLKYFGEKVP